MANLECNAVSAVQITHLLLSRMRAKKLRGCFVYTSSGGGLALAALLCWAAIAQHNLTARREAALLDRNQGGAGSVLLQGSQMDLQNPVPCERQLLRFADFHHYCLSGAQPMPWGGATQPSLPIILLPACSRRHDPQPLLRALRLHQVLPVG